MRTLCAGFVWTTIGARLSLLVLDKISLRFTRKLAYITEKSQTKNMYYAACATCMATPLFTTLGNNIQPGYNCYSANTAYRVN